VLQAFMQMSTIVDILSRHVATNGSGNSGGSTLSYQTRSQELPIMVALGQMANQGM